MTPPPEKPPRPGRRSRSRAPRRREPLDALHPVEDPPDIESFEHWDLGASIQAAIRGMGIEKPTPIQALAIGPILEGRDVIAKAETGTGKTLAFGAPMMARMDPQRSSVLALVLCPTRELSEQVFRVLEELGQASDLSVALIVGGEEMRPQVEALQAGAQVVVGTPGRVLDLMNQRFLSFPWTEFAVLDEADKMLEIGFIDDVKKILAAIPDERQTLLFSATFPPPLLALARGSTREPAEIATAKGVATVDTISQHYVEVDEEQRPRVLSRIIRASAEDDVFLVFCERRTDVDRLLRWMERERFPVKALHGGYDQASRFRVMSAFRDGDVKALLATDVASRGLDVHHVSHVVNYGVPRDVSDYTHRIGRTGRAGRTGVAITLVTPRDRRSWSALIRGTPWKVEELDPRDLERDRDRPRRDRGRARGDDRSRSDDRGPRRPRDEPRPDERSDRPSRDEPRERSEGRRGQRPDERGGRPRRERPERPERPGRSERTDRSERSDRPAKPGRRERDERPERKPRERSDERRPGGRERQRDEAERRRDEDRSGRPAKRPRPEAGAGGFGLGVFEPEKKERKPRRPKKERADHKQEKKSPERTPATRDDGATGFGAGL